VKSLSSDHSSLGRDVLSIQSNSSASSIPSASSIFVAVLTGLRFKSSAMSLADCCARSTPLWITLFISMPARCLFVARLT